MYVCGGVWGGRVVEGKENKPILYFLSHFLLFDGMSLCLYVCVCVCWRNHSLPMPLMRTRAVETVQNVCDIYSSPSRSIFANPSYYDRVCIAYIILQCECTGRGCFNMAWARRHCDVHCMHPPLLLVATSCKQ